MEYSDIQINGSVVDPIGRIATALAIQNLADGEVAGAEIDLTLRPTDNWLVTVNAGFLDAKYTDVAGTAGARYSSQLELRDVPVVATMRKLEP